MLKTSETHLSNAPESSPPGQVLKLIFPVNHSYINNFISGNFSTSEKEIVELLMKVEDKGSQSEKEEAYKACISLIA